MNAAPAVQAQALPFLRIIMVGSTGMLLFFMLSGALRSAGDARTPMILGIAMTVLNIVLNVVLIRGLGPIPAFGTAGAAMGTVHLVEPRRRLFGLEARARRMGRLASRMASTGSSPIGRSSNRCSSSVCRREFKASR